MGGLPNQRYPLFNDTINLSNTSIEAINFDEVPQSRVATIFMCIPSKGYESFFRTYIPVFDILLVAVIPFFLLCFTNIGIITFTMRTNRRMRQYRKRAHRRHQRLTIMLLSVTLAFIGLTCPSVIFICVNKIIYSMRIRSKDKTNSLHELIGSSQPSNVQLLIEICEALWYTKHAMNFILYTLSGQDFRKEFLKLFTQCFQNRPSILKKIMNQNQRTSEQNIDSSLIEIPIMANTNHRKKLKKQNNNNNHEISNIISINTKTMTRTTSITPQSVF